MSLGVSTNTYFASTINALCNKAYEAHKDPDDYFTENKQDFLEEQAKLLARHIPNASDKEQALFNFLDRAFQIIVTDIQKIKVNNTGEHVEDGLWDYQWDDFNVLWMQDPCIEDLQLVDGLGYQFSYEELDCFMSTYLEEDPKLIADKTKLHAVTKLVVENLFRHGHDRRLQAFTGHGWTFPDKFPNLESKKEYLDLLLGLDIQSEDLMSEVLANYIPKDPDLVKHLLDEHPVDFKQVSNAIYSALLSHTNALINTVIPDLVRLKGQEQSFYAVRIKNFKESIQHIETKFPILVEGNYKVHIYNFFIDVTSFQKQDIVTDVSQNPSADEANEAHRILIHLLEDIGF